MSGSQQSSRCRAIWNVMKRSRYMWLGRNGRGNIVMSKLTHEGNKLNTQKQVHIPTGGLLSTTHASETPVAPVVTDTCYVEKLKSLQKSAQQGKKNNLHSPLVLSHQLGGKLAEDVQESQVERWASLSLGTRLLKCKLDTIPKKYTDREV